MPNFWSLAKRIGDAASGWAAGDLQRQKMLTDERQGLLKLGLEAGAQGVDASGLISPDMVLNGNREYVANTYPTLTGTFTQGYKDKQALANRQLGISEKHYDDARAHYERADANAARQIDETSKYRLAQIAATSEARAARLAQAQQIADARLAQQDLMGTQASLKDQQAARDDLQQAAVNKYTEAYGKPPYSVDAKGKEVWDPAAMHQINQYVSKGMEYLDGAGTFRGKKSEYAPGAYRDLIRQYDQGVQYKPGESGWFGFGSAGPGTFDFGGVQMPRRTGGLSPDRQVIGDPTAVGGGDAGGGVSQFDAFVSKHQDIIGRAATADARQQAINAAVAEFSSRVSDPDLIAQFRSRISR